MAAGLPVVHCASSESAVDELVRDEREGVTAPPTRQRSPTSCADCSPTRRAGPARGRQRGSAPGIRPRRRGRALRGALRAASSRPRTRAAPERLTPPADLVAAQKLRELRDLRRAQGVRFVLRLLLRWIGLPWWRRAAGLDARRFVYDGREYPYHLSRYRLTWMNERAVEIPLALAALAGVPPDAVLEVGNCTRHYAPSPHRVVDRYEQAPGVENIDVLESCRSPGIGWF
jgi:hypothetical protein